MSQVSSEHPQESGKNSTKSSERSAPNKNARPGWPEIIVGLVVWSIAVFALSPQLERLDLDTVVNGLIFTSLSGVIGIAAFAAAYMVRIRSLSAFGVRRTTARWLLIGVGAGVAALILRSLVSGAYILITGDNSNPQTVYAEGASGGVLALILATIFLGILTPFGEELLFRGVVTNALLRYGPIFGVAGSALVFALFHGINPAFPSSLVIGLIAAEVFRRSGSIWPAVIVHVVCNLPAPLISVLAGLG